MSVVAVDFGDESDLSEEVAVVFGVGGESGGLRCGVVAAWVVWVEEVDDYRAAFTAEDK